VTGSSLDCGSKVLFLFLRLGCLRASARKKEKKKYWSAPPPDPPDRSGGGADQYFFFPSCVHSRANTSLGSKITIAVVGGAADFDYFGEAVSSQPIVAGSTNRDPVQVDVRAWIPKWETWMKLNTVARIPTYVTVPIPREILHEILRCRYSQPDPGRGMSDNQKRMACDYAARRATLVCGWLRKVWYSL